LTSAGIGAEWRVTPSLTLSETYTDNVELNVQDEEESDFITEIAPGIALAGRGSRFLFDLGYRLQALVHAQDGGRDRINHDLAATARAEWIDEFFFTDASANIFQQSASLLGARGFNDNNTTDPDNREDVRTFLVSPYIRSRLGSTAQYELRYAYDWADTSSDRLSRSQANRLSASLSSGPRFVDFGWSLNAQKEDIDYKEARDVTRETVSADASYALTPRFRVLGTIGHEDNDFITLDESPEGSFWKAGFGWAPTPRTNLEATMGERFFGDTYSFALTHSGKQTIWRANYNEEITTTRSEFFDPSFASNARSLDALLTSSIPDPVQRAETIRRFLVQTGVPASQLDALNFFTEEFFLEKRLEGSVAYNSARHFISANLFSESRERLSNQAFSTLLVGSDFALSDDIEEHGASGTWSVRLGPRTSTNLVAGYTRSDFKDTNREDDFYHVAASLVRQLRPRMFGAVEVRRQQRDSTDASAEYTENAVVARLTMTF
jgi:uncharacterized protein (PEP-CTERM system associated)